MTPELKTSLEKIAGAIRGLSIDAVQKANSGHPGMPMGCAEFAAYLYGSFLRHNPKDSQWLNRDRLILSAGHGCMLLYSALHLSGFDLSIDEIKNFRKLHSRTPGHPELHHTEGVEATTGPLGQGVGNAAGQALGLKLLAAKFNTEKHALFTSKVVCLAGDGCIMEGISSEVSSLAGHLNLNNLILVHDANKVSLDGPLSESCSEDTKARYKSYGWEVYELDGYDWEGMDSLFNKLRKHQERPAFIEMRTIIGKGSPNKAGSSKAHGSPLGPEELLKSKQSLGLSEEDFYVPHAVYTFFEKKREADAAQEEVWKKRFDDWKAVNPELSRDFVVMQTKLLPVDLEAKLEQIPMKQALAGRTASNEVLNMLGGMLPQIYGGSADLSCSDMTMMQPHNKFGVVAAKNFKGRNIKYGVREFGMAAMAAGLAQTQMIIPYIGTFLTFSDYMRNAIRLAALSKVQVIYLFTHDSILLGEDGPTHQPVEHIASLRAIPNLQVIRPADNNEVKMAWIAALRYSGPTALILSRQALPELPVTRVPFEKGVGRGAYIVKSESSTPDFTLFATGSELTLAMDVAEKLKRVLGKAVRVVSMPCWELFEAQDADYRKSVVGGNLGQRVCIEAGVELGWHKYIGLDGIAICMQSFGASAPAGALAQEFGFNIDSIIDRLLSKSSGG